MGEIVYQYDDLDKTHNSKSALNLSCICCEGSFSYLIHSEGDIGHFRAKIFVFDRRYQGFSKPLGYLSEVLRKDRLLFKDFHRKTIAIRGVPFIHLDQNQVRHDDPESLLANQTDMGPNDVTQTDVVGNTGYTLVFSIPKSLDAELQLYYKDVRVRHSLSSLLCHAFSRSYGHESVVHVNISHQWLEIVVVEYNVLAYINQMRWYNQSDVVYYIAALLENLNIDDGCLYEFSGSAYKSELHDHLVAHLSIDKKQIIRSDDGHDQVLDLRNVASCE